MDSVWRTIGFEPFLGSTQHPVLVIVHNVVKHVSIGWIEWHVHEAKL